MSLRPRHATALALALAAVAALPFPASSPARATRTARPAARGCANADTPAARASRQAMRDAVLCLINAQRRLHHLPALHVSARLDRSAQSWTDEMVNTANFSHGMNFAGRISAAGYDWSSAGENIATGFRTPREVVQGWMASPGHCENILDPTYESVGTGVNSRPLGRYGGATWTQDFGLWMGHRPPSGNDGPAQGCPYHI